MPGWAVASLACLLVLKPGCQSSSDADDACRVGDDPMAGLSISTADCSNAPCRPHFPHASYDFEATGDATVMAVASANGEHQFELHFIEDATVVSFTAFLPGDIPLPFSEGDVVDAKVSVWYTVFEMYTSAAAWAHIQNADGLLIYSNSGEFSVDPLPPPCEGTMIGLGCGPLGYPSVTFCHPDYYEDPSATCVELRQRESADLVWNSRAYSVYLPEAWVQSPANCTENPLGYKETIMVRRLDLEVH